MNVEEPSNQSHAYLDAFLTERPRDGVEFVQNRLRKALKLNEELAEYFKERAHAEDLYAKSLAKLSKKYFVTDKSALGLMVPIWEMLQNELTELYTIHSVFALKITEDIERPLRSSIQNDRDYESIKTLDIGMQRLVKDFDERLTRVQKHKKNMGKKSEAATKLADATKSLEDVRAQWQRSGTDYIEKHQAVDEHRLEALKNTIQSFEVLQTDQLLKRIEVSNNVLSAVSGFDIQEEINAFCASKPKNIHSLKPASAAANAAEEPLAPVPAIQTTDTSIEIPQSERSITSFESSATQEPVPTPSVSDSNRSRAGSTKKAGRERKFLSTLVSIRRKPKATDNNGYLNADLASPAMNHDDGSIASAGINNGSFISNGNSIHEHDDKHDHSNIQSDDAASSAAPTSPTSFRSTTIEMSPSQAGSTLGHDQQQRHHEPMVDAEGYTIPPPDRAVWPGDAAVASLIDDDFSSDNASTFSNQQRLQVNIRNESVAEEDKTAAVALNRVSSILKEKSPLASGRRRGRREMRSTRLLNPVQEVQQQQHQEHQQPPVITSEPVTPIPSNAEPVSPFEDVAEPTTTTVTPAAAAPPKIKVQITETIHAQLKGGQVARSAIWGEVKITYYGPAETSAPVCFEFNSNKSSARVVPNENYIKAVEGHPGIYQLQTSMYNLAGESAVPSIKYQIDTDPHDAVIPLLVKPMWKCDQDQTRLLVKYRKNPNSVLPDVHGVFFMTTVSGNVQGVQSIPAGQWMVDQQRMVWPVDEWQDTKEQTLRAKFVTTEQGSPQPLAVRFEVKDALASTVSVTRPENGDEEYLWADVQVVERMVRSGKYVAEV